MQTQCGVLGQRGLAPDELVHVFPAVPQPIRQVRLRPTALLDQIEDRLTRR